MMYSQIQFLMAQLSARDHGDNLSVMKLESIESFLQQE